MSDFGDRLDKIYERMQKACDKSHRDLSEVTLVAVSKTFPPEAIDEARSFGLNIFGENKVQEALAKSELCGSAEWHLIGPLQSNKIRHALSLFDCIHSIDSVKVLEGIARISDEMGARPRLMLEVNTGGESSKHGFTKDNIFLAIEKALNLGGLNLVGLMTIPPWSPNPEDTRKYFAMLRELKDEICENFKIVLPELSMGMSSDFDIAIEEGATFIRVGTALFGTRKSWKPVNRALDTDDFV